MNYNPFDSYGCFWKQLAVNLAAMTLCAVLLVLAWLTACWTFAQAVALVTWMSL